MDYSIQFTKLRAMLQDTGNTNLLRDFFVQFQSVRNLNRDMLFRALDGKEELKPPFLPLVSKSDIRNIVVFLMWKEFETVIDARGDMYSEESKLGTKIEDFSIYLETKYYVNQIRDVKTAEPLSFIEWVKTNVEKHGLPKTINRLYAMIRS